MANHEDTLPAPSGKAIAVEYLISEALTTITNAYSGLRQLESCSDKSLLEKELSLLQGMANYISDANCTIDAVLENLHAAE